VPDAPSSLPDFVTWPSFPFEGDLRVKPLEAAVDREPPREGEDADPCVACTAPDESYIWVSERWRVRAPDRPSGLPMVLILESRSHLDLGDLPNMLAAELGVMTVRLERAVRSLDGVARVHVNRWGDGAAHLHLWFFARPQGRLQLRGSFLPLWEEILPPIPESQWRENLALVAAWLGEFGGRSLAEPPHIEWQAPAKLSDTPVLPTSAALGGAAPDAEPVPDSAAAPEATAEVGSTAPAQRTPEGGETERTAGTTQTERTAATAGA
jgi:diadenosine tetraphosphate (Ap4A) HIT family hydrolase